VSGDITSKNQVTQILNALQQGDPKAAEQLLPFVYDELRKLAAQRMGDESSGRTLQPTALVHEAYLRLVDVPNVQEWNGRGHFFAAAAEAMRRILVEKARHRRRLRHGGGRHIDLSLDAADAATDGGVEDVGGDLAKADELLALDEALARLAVLEPQIADVVKLRYFAGLTAEQAADAMGISLRTANRHWAYAKAWLHRQVNDDRRDGDESRPPA
jgi:RNA polymerase sigma factor (TIGR02999 family)